MWFRLAITAKTVYDTSMSNAITLKGSDGVRTLFLSSERNWFSRDPWKSKLLVVVCSSKFLCFHCVVWRAKMMILVRTGPVWQDACFVRPSVCVVWVLFPSLLLERRNFIFDAIFNRRRWFVFHCFNQGSLLNRSPNVSLRWHETFANWNSPYFSFRFPFPFPSEVQRVFGCTLAVAW